MSEKTWSSAVQAQAAGHHEYHRRARAVFWRQNTGDTPLESRCGVRGLQNADCMLVPRHSGDHYGPGYDKWGPKGPYQWETSNG